MGVGVLASHEQQVHGGPSHNEAVVGEHAGHVSLQEHEQRHLVCYDGDGECRPVLSDVHHVHLTRWEEGYRDTSLHVIYKCWEGVNTNNLTKQIRESSYKGTSVYAICQCMGKLKNYMNMTENTILISVF